MSGPEAEFWDRVYAGDDYRFGSEPNAFLAERAGAIPPGGTTRAGSALMARRAYRRMALQRG